MISYHPKSAAAPVGTTFTAGFSVANTDDVNRIARGISKFVWSQGIFEDGYRRSTNFRFADWIALDFDSPDMSLAEARNVFCDMTHIIGTTRNHQVDKHGIICDRYRVLLKPERRILTLWDYKATVRAYADRYPIDTAATDGTRLWFPCREIVSIEPDGYTADVIRGKSPAQIAAERHYAQAKYQHTKRLPAWVTRFLEQGRTCRSGSAGRNQTIYAVSVKLAELGFDYAEILRRVEAAPFPRELLEPNEIPDTVLNGFKKGRD